MQKIFTLLLLVAALTTGAARADSVTLTWESCVALDTIVTKSGVCYIRDLQKAGGHWEVTVAFGININVGTVVVGGGGSSMLVAKAVISDAASKAEAMSKLKAYLNTLPLSAAAQSEIIQKVTPILGRSPSSPLSDAKKQAGAFTIEEVNSSSPIGNKM